MKLTMFPMLKKEAVKITHTLKNRDKVSVSKMTGKLKGVDAINASPANNKYCLKMSKNKDSICYKCFSLSTMKRYKTADRRFQNNGRLLSETSIDPTSIELKSDIVRLSAHGELLNYKHLVNMISIVKVNSGKIFTLWTKRIDLVARYLKTNDKPKNLILIRSSKDVNVKVPLPEGFDKVFTVYSKEYLSLDGTDGAMIDINCGSKSCFNCRKCYTKTDRSTFINEVLK